MQKLSGIPAATCQHYIFNIPFIELNCLLFSQGFVSFESFFPIFIHTQIPHKLSTSFFFQDEAAEAAKNAGANIVGGEELIKQVMFLFTVQRNMKRWVV